MSKLKHFILDTNVLMHNPDALNSFTDNIVVIPITVVEELDKFKNGSDKKSMHARQVLRNLDAHIKKGALSKGSKTENNGRLKVLFPPTDIQLPDLDYSIHDNKILTIAYSLQKKGEEVFFISKDVNARIKAEALGIKTADYEKQKVEYRSLYKGWREIQLPNKDIQTLYSKKELNLKSFTLHPNEYLHIKSSENDNTSVLAYFDEEKQIILPLTQHFDAMGIKPINLEQQFAFDLLLNPKVNLVTLIGQAGTGKTLIAIACGLSQILKKTPTYEKLLVARPIIPLGKDIGYLPGTKDQKLNYWMQPIFDNLNFIFSKEKTPSKKNVEETNNKKRKERIDSLLDDELIEIEAITYIRGRSIPNQFIIIDEAQNLTPHEIKTIISRAGENTKIILTGDPEQIDNPYLDANSNGLSYTAERLKDSAITGQILLSKSERSALASVAVSML